MDCSDTHRPFFLLWMQLSHFKDASPDYVVHLGQGILLHGAMELVYTVKPGEEVSCASLQALISVTNLCSDCTG